MTYVVHICVCGAWLLGDFWSSVSLKQSWLPPQMS